MLVRRRMAGGCLFVIALLAAGRPALADPFAAGLKWGLEKAIGQLAKQGYVTNCQAANLDFEADDSWYCGAFAALSGQDKKHWEERVMHRLGKIEATVAQIRSGVAAILEGQQAIYNQNQQILVRLDEIGAETNIGQALSKVRVLYNDQYVPLFTGKRPFEAKALLAFAHRVVFEEKIDQQLGIVNDQLTHADFGKDRLLRSYAKRMSLKMDAAKDGRLEPPYDYLESVVDGVLAEQRKGYLLYVWAATTLQSACEMNATDCDDYHHLPHTATQFRGIFEGYVAAQLTELDVALEWLVLARSDLHSRQADFLRPEAARLFARNDLFRAGNLGNGYGVVGRVISMGAGKVFDGTLRYAELTEAPQSTTTFPTAAGPVDWWRATGDLGYDEIHFADQWEVYHYHAPEKAAGRYTIDTPLPYRPEISVETVTLNEDTQVPFGSFTAIARAGGGYALLSGPWSRREEGGQNVVGEFYPDFDDKLTDFAAPYAGVRFSGRIEWNVKHTGMDQHIEGGRAAYAVSRKKIRYPEGGELTLHAAFGDTYPILCPQGACADYRPNMVLWRWSNFREKGFGTRPAELTPRTFFLLDKAREGSNGFVWEKTHTFSSEVNDRVTAGDESKRVRLDQGAAYPLILGGAVTINMQTSGLAASRWSAVAMAKVDNAYLSR